MRLGRVRFGAIVVVVRLVVRLMMLLLAAER